MPAPQQNTPNFTGGGSLFGRIAAQWNQYFEQKERLVNDYLQPRR
jgi:hypothetical protein